MYTFDKFKEEVDKNGGPEKVMVLYFNNSYNKGYGKGEVLSYDDIEPETGIIRFREKDPYGNEFITTRMLEYLEGITFAAPGVSKDEYDHMFLRG